VDYNLGLPSINAIAFPSTAIDLFFTSTPVAGNSSYEWYVSFGVGRGWFAGLVCSHAFDDTCYGVAKNNRGSVRCVRPLSMTQVHNRYTDEFGNPLTIGSTQVRDRITGLIWQRTAGSGIENQAHSYCSSLSLGEQSWRLPSIKELSTLLDVSVSTPGPMINMTAFPSTPNSNFWSASSVAAGSAYCWSILFDQGIIAYDGCTAGKYIRCVCSPVVGNPEWANWNAATGVYMEMRLPTRVGCKVYLTTKS
jgi:hypothetical protein